MQTFALLKNIRRALTALLLATPFISLFISNSMFFPFITGRNFAFRIIVEVAAILWVGLLFLDPDSRPKKNALNIAVVAWLVIVFAADMFGVNPYRSFFSNYERMEGFLSLGHLGLYFLMLQSTFRSKREWSWFFHTVLGVGVLAGIYGLLQQFGKIRSLQGGARIDGPVGNPAYFAAYLILIVVIALYLLLDNRENIQRSKVRTWFYIGISVFALILIYFTATRGALLAVIVGLIGFPIAYLVFGKKEETNAHIMKKASFIILAVAILLPTLFLTVRKTEFVHQSSVLSRLASISLDEKTTRSRFMVWDMAWQAFKERPVLGWGQENFIEAFSKYYNPKMFDQEPWFDRTHNIIFDWLTAAGALGLLGYLAMFGAAFFFLHRFYKAGTMTSSAIIVLGVGLLAYLGQNMFVFDNLNTYILFFAILGFLGTLAGTSESLSPKGKNENAIPASANYSVIGMMAAAMIMIYPLYFWNLKPIHESRAIIQALISTQAIASSKNGLATVRENFEKTFSYNTFGNGEAVEQLGQTATNLTSSGSNAEAQSFIKFAIEKSEEHLAKFPGDPRMRLFIATIYNRVLGLDPSYAKKAEDHINQFLKLSPKRQLGYLVLGEHYLNRGMNDEGLAAARKAVDLAPEFDGVWAAFAQLAVAARAHAVVEEILQENNSTEVLDRIGLSYVSIEDYGRARVFYEELVSRQPENIEYRSRLADIYVQLGLYDAAIKEAKALAELNPDEFGDKAKLFIEQIEALRR